MPFRISAKKTHFFTFRVWQDHTTQFRIVENDRPLHLHQLSFITSLRSDWFRYLSVWYLYPFTSECSFSVSHQHGFSVLLRVSICGFSSAKLSFFRNICWLFEMVVGLSSLLCWLWKYAACLWSKVNRHRSLAANTVLNSNVMLKLLFVGFDPASYSVGSAHAAPNAGVYQDASSSHSVAAQSNAPTGSVSTPVYQPPPQESGYYEPGVQTGPQVYLSSGSSSQPQPTYTSVRQSSVGSTKQGAAYEPGNFSACCVGL